MSEAMLTQRGKTKVRVGPCMEVMDCLAGDVAVRHIGDPGAHVVTAAVDEIEWNAAAVPTVRDDLILRGTVLAVLSLFEAMS